MTQDQIDVLKKQFIFKGERIEVTRFIETHASWVFCTPRYTFKLKKPQKYSFLDFSTQEKRRACCEQEVKLNRRLTDIYLDTVSINLSEDQIEIAGKGERIDTAVWMKTIDHKKEMEPLLQKGQVPIEQVTAIAKQIADFHRSAEQIHTPFDLPKAKTQFDDLNCISNWVNKHMSTSYVQYIENAVKFSAKTLDTLAPLIKKRIDLGLQKDLHGDLHSKNIFLEETPIIFDCIEFNAAFRQIDVLNEVAFFCMDMEAHNRLDLSDHFMQVYLEHSPVMETSKEKALFKYYKCYRANVRAKVSALKLMNDPTPSSHSIREVKIYLELLRSYCD